MGPAGRVFETLIYTVCYSKRTQERLLNSWFAATFQATAEWVLLHDFAGIRTCTRLCSELVSTKATQSIYQQFVYTEYRFYETVGHPQS